MIEKVRSIAMISSLQSVGLSVAGLISAPSQDGKRDGKRSGAIRLGSPGWPSIKVNYDNFTEMNPLCNRHPGFVHLRGRRLAIKLARTADVAGARSAVSPPAPVAPNP
jgi:hypothetical protein